MANQPRYEPLEASTFFDDGKSARHLVPGTIPRGYLRIDDHFYEGTVNGQHAQELPMPVTRELLERGQQRYDIYCSPCHDRVGNGQGMVVRRGFPAPPSMHIPRLRSAPVGHFYDVIVDGIGRMPSYAQMVPPEDRWAVIAYIRALQLSQHASPAQLEDVERDAITRGGTLPRTDQPAGLNQLPIQDDEDLLQESATPQPTADTEPEVVEEETDDPLPGPLPKGRGSK
ncbi:MAG: cytochrome c [Pirellulales bacterium]